MSSARPVVSDFAVIGGGLVGSALAYGLARSGAAVLLLDGDDDSFHASGGNFGLVWVQGKGLAMPEYAALSRRSADIWGDFSQMLAEESGIETGYRQTGGIKIALDETELEAFETLVRRMHNQPPPGGSDTRMLDRKAMRELIPELGPAVVGGSYCPHDGFADPLATLTALRKALRAFPNARIERGAVRQVRGSPEGGFTLSTRSRDYAAGKVVLAAGLGNIELAPQLALHAPLRPQRGQILVSERLPPFLPLACHNVRQTREGTVLLGDSHEDVGYDHGTSQGVARSIARRAVASFPCLAAARLVRQWGALRVLSPDGFPIYEESERHPGAYLVTCHSGVTLAAVHALDVSGALVADSLRQRYSAFSATRFTEAVT